MITQATNSATTAPSPSTQANFGSNGPQTDRSFESIIDDYWSNPDKGNSLDYLNGLSGTDLKTIGQEHGFANPTPNLNGITTEGANNLLRNRGETIDENRDGIDQIGEARTWHFPNSNTPPEVANAWDQATEGMEDSEKMLMAGILFMPLPMVVTNETTGTQRIIHPGEEGYVNPKTSGGYSFMDTVKNKLRALDDPSNPPTNIEFYNKAKDLYQKLVEAFESNGVS